MGNKLILIENKSQAEKYLKNKRKFQDAIPIVFTYPAEKVLRQGGVNFKLEEDYESPELYGDLHFDIKKLNDKIFKKIKINYKEIELFQIFYLYFYDTFQLAYKYFKLLNKIKSIEKPSNVYIFKSNNFSENFKIDICSRIGQLVFKEKTKIISYKIIPDKKQFMIKCLGSCQKILTKIKLFSTKKNENKIFYCGSKRIFGPLLEKILLDGKNKIFRTYNNLQKSFFINNNYIPFYEFSSKNKIIPTTLKKQIGRLNQSLKGNFLRDVKIEKEIKIFLKEFIFYICNFKFLEVVGYINQIEKLIHKNKINLLLLDADSLIFGKILSQICNKHNLPCIVLMHGICNNKESFTPLSAKYIIVFGEESKKRLIKFNVPKQKIISLGSPQFDEFFKFLKQSYETDQKKTKKILFAMSSANSYTTIPNFIVTKKEQKQMLEILFNVMKKFPDYKLIIKGRKGFEMNDLPSIIARKIGFKNFELIDDVKNDVKLISDCDIFITQRSDMGMKAMALNKPLISLDFKNLKKFAYYLNTNAAKVVYNEKQLEKTIKELINNPNKNKKDRINFLENEFFKLDDKSSKRIKEFIYSILNK
tara:strand:- start:28121 stop:29887 length:1767 start_codon:yes stop_codon:yes gene_type:complete